MNKYINPYTDFGFKRLFGTEGNKDLLIDFLNCLMPAKHQITDLTFRNVEQLGEIPSDRKAVYDIYCHGANGDLFIVEMQKAKINGFVFYDKLGFRFLQMPFFNKTEDELATHYDKWCYFLKHLDSFDHIPQILNEPLFDKAFKTAELAAMTGTELFEYEQSKMVYWELKSAMDTSREDGATERAFKIAQKMKIKGEPIENIIEYTGFSREEIEKL